MKLPGVPYTPRYTSDELVLGVVVAARAARARRRAVRRARRSWPQRARDEEEKPLVARPVIQASLLKLGKPIDPKKLPDRFVPQAAHRAEEAGRRLARGSRRRRSPTPARRRRRTRRTPTSRTSSRRPIRSPRTPARRAPRKVTPRGIDGGQETDPNKVKAGDMYAAQLGQFFAERNHVPTIISVGEARRLCVVFEMQRRSQHGHLARPAGAGEVERQPDCSTTRPGRCSSSSSTTRLRFRHPRRKSTSSTVLARCSSSILGDPHGDPSRCK